MESRPVPDRFLVAFSLAGEQRDLVRSIAEEVERRLGWGTVFFDEWFQHCIAGDDADLRLQDIYAKRSALVVPCLSARYSGKPWTRAEHRIIRALQMRLSDSKDERDTYRILPLRVGDGDDDVSPFNTITPDARTKTTSETAQLIVDRLLLVIPDAIPRQGPGESERPTVSHQHLTPTVSTAAERGVGDADVRQRPIPAAAYAAITFVAGITGIALLVGYVRALAAVVQPGSQSHAFYVLLLPSALACAITLFGLLRSVARLTSKELGGRIEVAGPVVLFCVVVAAGFGLIPAATPLALTVRAHSSDGKEPIIKAGTIFLDLENDPREESLQLTGAATFKEIPPRYWRHTIRLIPHVDGYRDDPQLRPLESSVIDLALEREVSATRLAGTIISTVKNDSDYRIVVDGGRGEGTADSRGRFAFPVLGRDGDTVRLKIYSGDMLVYDDFAALPGPLTISVARRQ